MAKPAMARIRKRMMMIIAIAMFFFTMMATDPGLGWGLRWKCEVRRAQSRAEKEALGIQRSEIH